MIVDGTNLSQLNHFGKAALQSAFFQDKTPSQLKWVLTGMNILHLKTPTLRIYAGILTIGLLRLWLSHRNQ